MYPLCSDSELHNLDYYSIFHCESFSALTVALVALTEALDT